MYRSSLFLLLISSSTLQASACLQALAEADTPDLSKQSVTHRVTAQLAEAAQKGEGNRIESLINLGADINGTTRNYFPPLIEAVRHGHKAFVETLLKKGAYINVAIEKKGWTALHYACHRGNVELVALLLEHDADSKVVTDQGLTPLELAVRNLELEVLQVFKKLRPDNDYQPALNILLFSALQKNLPKNFIRKILVLGADQHAVGNHEETALHIACYLGSLEVVKLLLDQGASAKAQNAKGDTPLWYACRKNHHSVVELCCRAVQDDQQFCTKTLKRALNYGCSREVIAELLVTGACSTYQEVESALKQGNVSQALEVLNSWQELTLSSDKKNNLMVLLSDLGQSEQACLLVDTYYRDEEPEVIKNITSELVAHKASLPLIEKLLALVSAADIAGDYGHELLSLAIEGQLVELVVALFQRNAGSRVRGRLRSKRVADAFETGNVALLKQVLSHTELSSGSMASLVFKELAGNQSLEVLKVLLDADESLISYENDAGTTFLHKAVASNSLPIVQEFVERGANVLVADKWGATPVSNACLQRQKKIIPYLAKKAKEAGGQDELTASVAVLVQRGASAELVTMLSNEGADLKLVDENTGQTLLHRAASQGSVELVKFLLPHTSCSAIDKDGATPLHTACKGGRIKVVQELLRHGANKNVLDNQGKKPFDYWIAHGFTVVFDEQMPKDAYLQDEQLHSGRRPITKELLGAGLLGAVVGVGAYFLLTKNSSDT